MGVRGLSKFVDDCGNLSRSFELHDTSVVIDGCSLFHYLYRYSGADYMYGGDYDVYATTVKEYFSRFEECNIKSIVIFDGGYDKSDRMFKKLLERQKHRLENIEKLIRKEESSTEVLPINACEVFKNVLSEMGIVYAQCDYEGDNQMASLATQYCCPILSEDSDFYIYDLPNGFIRLNFVESEVKTRSGSNVRYLSSKIYYLKALLSVYPLRDRTVLSLLATLAGNDYASPYEEFRQFYYRTNPFGDRPFGNKFQRLFAWLRDKTLEEAKSNVLALLELENRESVRSIIESSIEDYKIKPSNMVDILFSLRSHEYTLLIHKTKLIAACGESLPREFVVAFHKGQLPTTLLNAMTLHRNILSPQFDDFSSYSSYSCSRGIRQVIYGILLQHNSTNSERRSHACIKAIEEYDRVGGSLQKIRVEFLSKLQNGDPVVKLSDIHTMQKNQLRDFMVNVMEVKEDFISGIPSNLQLIFVCVNYWLLKSSPKPPTESLPAFLLGIMYFQAKEKLFNDDAPPEAMLSHSNAKLVFENLKRYLQKQNCSRISYDIRIVHGFNQLQACILDCVTLNLLLNVPFELPKLHKVFNGTLLYNLTKELQSKQNHKSFIRQLLREEAFKLFNMLLRKFIDINKLGATYTIP